MRKVPALVLLGAGCYLLLRDWVYRPPQHVDVASLQLHDLSGNLLPPTLLTERPIVLNFWAPWCPPCLKELPWLADLQKQHADVTIVGIEQDPNALLDAVQMQETQPVAYTLAAPNALTSRTFSRISALPTTLYISRSGAVVHTVTGLVPESVMNKYLQDALRHK